MKRVCTFLLLLVLVCPLFGFTVMELIKTSISEKPLDGFAWKCETDDYDVYIQFNESYETIYIVMGDNIIVPGDTVFSDSYVFSFFNYEVQFLKNENNIFSLTCKLSPNGSGKALFTTIPLSALPVFLELH